MDTRFYLPGMSKFVLTRYLYIFDEVIVSFISSLLKKQSLDECYFWISEVYYSGFIEQAWDLVWYTYYDFYFIQNPSFEPFLSKKFACYDLKSILTVVKNLFKMDTTSQIFITRQYYNHIKEVNHVFRGKKPNWLTTYPTKYHALFRFIDKKLYHFAVSSMPDTIEDDLFQYIQLYFQISDDIIEHFKTRFQECKYYNQGHIVWSIICLFIFNTMKGALDTDHYSIKKKTIYIGCSDIEYYEIVQAHEEPIPLDKFNHPQIYKTLELKRKYTVYPKCMSFNLMRQVFSDHNNLDIARILWHHWEFYAYECPIWNSRFNKYNITVDTNNTKIIFNDDDELESFYSQFGYDPEEQSTDTQNNGLLLDYNICSWRDWYNDMFSQDPVYSFKDVFKFKY